ncbi:MAG: DUF2194 domain-containing protein [Oscillospiraceae bacterium]|nr:DUF2194 domain-containing protein [Oscillospiraceae bacterium]
MVSRRNFLSIAAIMLIIFFMFQFTSVALELWNDYEENEYAVDVEALAGRAAAFGAEGIPARTAWGTERKCAAYIGGAGRPSRQVAEAWCAYAKRELIAAADLAAYSPGGRVPELLIVDGARLDWNTSACRKLLSYAAQGTSLVFASLPAPSVIGEISALRELLGIEEIRQERTQVKEIFLYDGFLLGGAVIYGSDDPRDAWRQDLSLTMPWYTLTTGTKVYMKGTPAGDVPLADHPPLIWRRSLGGAYVFAVNGDYMEDAAGLGILSAISYESSAYSVYPVVNAQNLVVANYPGLATENGRTLARYYSMSMRGVYRDILWPGVTSVYKWGGLGLSCMMAMQFDYADSAQPDAGQFIYYMKLINELNGEAGLSGSQVSDLPVTGKLAEDFAFLENARLPYQFSSFYAGALESTDVSAALGWEDMASVRTVVRPYTGGGGLIGYETDRVTWQTAVTDGLSHTYRSDLRMRGVETALAYTSVLVDMLDTVYPETVDDTWGLISKNLTSDVPSAWKSFGKFDATTVSECDGRVRDFLAMDYDSSYDGTTVRISRSGSGPAWFILRINQQTVDTVTGGSAVRLESGAFLIEAQAPEVTVALRVVHDAPA